MSLLDLSNYNQLYTIAQEPNLIQYSTSDISTQEKLKGYVQTAIDGFYQRTSIPFIIYDKKKQSYAGCARFGLIN